ncbi:MAG: tyrosine-type recombinase/integrase [Actinomycetota bacterium]|nr:tyrosine-type recombinase/integrase [Actinomycetota bacterium]
MGDVTQPGVLRGRVPANRGMRYPAEVLTPDEVRALMAQCSETSSTGIRYRALITLLYRTGMWASETLALRPKDVDLRAGFVVVLRGKGGRRRTVDRQGHACVDERVRRSVSGVTLVSRRLPGGRGGQEFLDKTSRNTYNPL